MTPSEFAQFDSNNNTFRTAGYFKYQFLDKESNMLPFAPGSYWAAQKVFNIGFGYDYHPDAMVRLENGLRKNEDMFHLSADIFYDAPLNENTGTAISLYGAWFHYDYGYNYLRNVGLVNPATGSVDGQVMASGPGNGYPMMGSGEVFYGQAGYMLPSKFKNFTLPFRLQVMGSAQMANYDRLNESMFWYETGLNILVDKYSKFTFSYQGRPVFEEVAAEPQSRLEVGTRKGTFILQYQFTVR
jgi:hypothetical protein